MQTDLFFLKVFDKKDSGHHSEWSATEKIWILYFHDTSLYCEIGNEGSQSGQMGSIGQKGRGVQDKVANMLMLFEMLEHLTHYFQCC